MQIFASSVQQTGASFLHAGYSSVAADMPYLLLGGVLFGGVLGVLHICKKKLWMDEATASVLEFFAVIFIVGGLILFAAGISPW